MRENIYCLDSNVLIQAWQKYYSPQFCPAYWDVLTELGKEGRIFFPEEVFNEINKTDDDLSKWLKKSNIPIHSINEEVIECLKSIYSKDEKHKNLVEDNKGRSLADPWVIAHALNTEAVVVTKEDKITATNTRKIKIPNVCDNMGIRWINDFDFIIELNIKFVCSR